MFAYVLDPPDPPSTEFVSCRFRPPCSPFKASIDSSSCALGIVVGGPTNISAEIWDPDA